MSYMQEVLVVNEEIKSILNELLWFYEHRSDLDNVDPDCLKEADQRAHFISTEYRNKIINMGSAHNGFPEALYGYNLRSMDDNKSKAIPIEWLERWNDINRKLMTYLAVKNPAVATLYPPGGFISWHNNANATGFNIILTWSETGDGNFTYIDEGGKEVVLQDPVQEWVCRYGMFGQYHQNEHPIVYHMADTNCWRFTFAFIFDASEASRGLQDFVIEELTTP